MSEAFLKPCPFCGSDDAKIAHDHGTYEPGCTHCGTYIGQYSSERSAVAAWNRRAAEFGQPAAWMNGDEPNNIISARAYKHVLEKNKSRWDVPLYAAAPPDLLQMLHECAEYIAALNGEQDDYCQRARALIARATGEVK